LNVSILTLFPEALRPYLDSSILGRAQQAGLLDVRLYNIRDYTLDKHRRVDDYPFGGGAGMVMTPQPIFDCMEAALQRHGQPCVRVYMSPQGRVLDNRLARELSAQRDIVMLCGHYEGVDQRALDACVDMEISIGDYVLTGGELPALVLLDAMSRFIPGVLGNEDAHADESFENGLLEYPQYTRPASFRGMDVPEVLLNGNHAHIQAWRERESMEKTRRARADLAEKHQNTSQL
jgi:tRNA (guanine37-N1)-methyltransferase